MDPYLEQKELVYEAYYAMKSYCEKHAIPFLNHPHGLNKLYDLNGILNSPIHVNYNSEDEDDINNVDNDTKVRVDIVNSDKARLNNLTIEEWLDKYNVYKINKKSDNDDIIDM